ncbi:EmmdR/YeeO family multidrug/toxin efflux MATE transporter [Salmonella enterica subsp. enterica serovar Typhi]|nr:EmmdR/YeeO family multidrug/toxin efflux MATE transporter [Salmonella enterica subsp. enterica serovar Typhi]
MTQAVMLQGTASDVGKSVLVAGLCRIFYQDGLRTAPFKSQNMALNSGITPDGKEMGRAQIFQAEAAGITPDVRMNPVLLKPTSDRQAQVVLMGKVATNMDAVSYHDYKPRLREQILAVYNSLAQEYDVIVLAVVIHYFGSEIINIVAGEATPEVKGLALTYLELTVLSYPAAAIALIGSGALRGAGNTKIPLMINGGMNILNIVISSILIYGAFSWQGLGFAGAGLGLTISRYIGAVAIIWVLMIGFNPALRIPLKSYLKPLNFGIIWEVMGIGIPASIESVLFNGGKLLTQMFVAGMGTNVIAGNFIAFSVAALINLPGNALGSASTIITGKRLGTGQIGQAERQLRHVFWMSTIVLTAIAWGTAPFAGLFASFYTQEQDVKEVVKVLLWLNAAFMPIWAAAWVLPSGFKGARDVRFAMWVSMLGMWGCRVVAGYTLGIVLGMGVVGVWLGMFLDWAVRGALFYWRLISGRWLWRYPRVKRE